MGAKELGYDRESLSQVTKGLKAAIDELEQFGSRTGSLMGSGVGELTLSKMEAGDAGLADDFEDFCDRWEWGVRALVQNADGLAERLNLSAGRVFEEDEYQAETWKVGLNAVAGNPHASEEEVTGAKTGYGDILKQNLRPDQGTQETNQQITQEWQDTKHAVTTEGAGGAVADRWAGQGQQGGQSQRHSQPGQQSGGGEG